MILGIDPGVSGAASIVDDGHGESRAFAKGTEKDMYLWLKERAIFIRKAWLEQVRSRPGQGVATTFTFGANYGWWRGVLVALEIPFEEVTPVVWQKALSCKSKGAKNVTKRKAQELFPTMTITHANADSLLIATYGERRHALIRSQL